MITVTPESYNKTIAAGATLSDVGIIIKANSEPGKITVSVK